MAKTESVNWPIVIQAGVAIVSFLLAPYAHRLVLFTTTPADWYGQVHIQSEEGFVGVVKNASPISIYPELHGSHWGVAQGLDPGLDEPFSLDHEAEAKVPPQSIAFYFSQFSTESPGHAKLPDGRRFKARDLDLVTPGEKTVGELGFWAVLLLLSVLAHRSTEYLRSDGTSPPIADGEGRP